LKVDCYRHAGEVERKETHVHWELHQWESLLCILTIVVPENIKNFGAKGARTTFLAKESIFTQMEVLLYL
jgi:hypothetical protein